MLGQWNKSNVSTDKTSGILIQTVQLCTGVWSALRAICMGNAQNPKQKHLAAITVVKTNIPRPTVDVRHAKKWLPEGKLANRRKRMRLHESSKQWYRCHKTWLNQEYHMQKLLGTVSLELDPNPSQMRKIRTKKLVGTAFLELQPNPS